MEDRKTWVILSLSEDGGLRITVPYKLNKSSLEKEVALLKDKKLGSYDKNEQTNK